MVKVKVRKDGVAVYEAVTPAILAHISAMPWMGREYEVDFEPLERRVNYPRL
ncbi:hypothetical protein [Fervidicola ferrireducens]|uniref:hypothetical protein n=1 Tax=Fervidicola ferrireducens TaxID=520764 RepID=UPI00165691E5|nr:hypothetical protein [Fervidicola ferrireducens]